ncbi:MAG: PAS domain-containing protein [Planctomycetota bacterium]
MRKKQQRSMNKEPKIRYDINLESAFDALPFYVILVDEDHNIVFANKVVRKHFGLELDYIVGQYCPKLIHGCDGPFPGCPLEEAIERGIAVEREVFDPIGKRWLISAIYPAGKKTSEGKDIYIHIVRDVTEKKEIQKELKRNYETQSIINLLLRMSIEDMSIDEILERALELSLFCHSGGYR